MQQIGTGKYKKSIYHIQHINAYHSRLKEFMIGFHGVATKYLANYMYWFKWIELFKVQKIICAISHLLCNYSNERFKKRKFTYND